MILSILVFLNNSAEIISKIPPYGDSKFSEIKNLKILETSISYIIKTDIFNDPCSVNIPCQFVGLCFEHLGTFIGIKI